MSRFPGWLNILAVLAFLLSSPQATGDIGTDSPGGGLKATNSMFANDHFEVYLPVVSSNPAPVSEANRITAGGYHTCALTTINGVKCWGDNEYGQLGDGTQTYHSTPWDVQGLTSGVSAIAAGVYHTCALTTPLAPYRGLNGGQAGGGVKCWGLNDLGGLGDGTQTNHSAPVDVQGLTSGVRAITAGFQHTCALTTPLVGGQAEGGVKCWGRNSDGELGDGTQTNRSTPVDVQGLTSGVLAISAGWFHTCALTSSGGVKCWGFNNYGELGDGTYLNARTTPVDVYGLSSGVSAIAAGRYHTCALTTPLASYRRLNGGQAAGGVKCWGLNISSQLGDGTLKDRYVPVDVQGLVSGMSAIAAGMDHTCALTTEGGMKCWGDNDLGEIGDGTRDNRSAPVDVYGLASGVKAMGVGGFHTCALTAVGGVKCWGFNLYGQLGDGTNTDRLTPVDVKG